MKILLVHNDYGKYSGEEAVVDKMAAMFDALGHDVVQLRKTTSQARDTISGKIRGFFSGIYCREGIKSMRDIISKEKPDLVNVHNLYPFIGPASLIECKKAKIPVVMTIHNYRLICPTGLFMRDNQSCELCLEKGNEWSCVKYNCEETLFKSIGYATRNAVARIMRYYIDCVDKFACITDFQRHKLIDAGYEPSKLTVIPNSVNLPNQNINIQGSYVAYSGRLSLEKGIDLIIEAARRNPDIPFKLAGAVRDERLLERLPKNVILTGYLSGKDLKDFYANARFFVMASRCYEGFPMTILEVAGYGKAMVAPDHGGFSEIIGRGNEAIGILFQPGNANALAKEIRNLWNNPQKSVLLGGCARKKIEISYTTQVVAQKWHELIESLVKKR